MNVGKKRHRKPKKGVVKTSLIWKKPTLDELNQQIEKAREMYHKEEVPGVRYPYTGRPLTDMGWALRYTPRKRTSTDFRLRKMLQNGWISKENYQMLVTEKLSIPLVDALYSKMELELQNRLEELTDLRTNAVKLFQNLRKHPNTISFDQWQRLQNEMDEIREYELFIKQPFDNEWIELNKKSNSSSVNAEYPPLYPRNVPIVPSKGELYLPVVRYSDIWHPTNRSGLKSPYQGTFYYVEPSSSVLLHVGKTRVFGSKCHAFATLFPQYCSLISKPEMRTFVRALINGIDDAILSEGGKRITKVQTLANPDHYCAAMIRLFWHLTIMLPPFSSYALGYRRKLGDQMGALSQNYFFTIATGDAKFDSYNIVDGRINENPFIPCQSDHENKTADQIAMYDWLDQPLTTIMKTLQLDTLVFQHERGQFRSVTEILDSRTNTYQHLIRTPSLHSWYKPQFQFCPTIWMPSDGFLTTTKLPTKKRRVIQPQTTWKRVPITITSFNDGTFTI